MCVRACVYKCNNLHKSVHLCRAAINLVERAVRFMLGGSQSICWMFIESSLTLWCKETNQLE